MPRVATALWILAGLLLAGAVGAAVAHERPDCPGHWHASFLVVMDGHPVRFANPVFLREPGGIATFDLHADDQIMHYHPQFGRDRCTPVKHFLAHLGIELTDGSIAFNENFGGNAGTYRNNATHELHVLLKKWDQPWEEVRWGAIDQRQLRQGERLLVTYGDLTPADLVEQQGWVRTVPDHYLPPSLRAAPVTATHDEHAEPSRTGTTAPGTKAS